MIKPIIYKDAQLYPVDLQSFSKGHWLRSEAINFLGICMQE